MAIKKQYLIFIPNIFLWKINMFMWSWYWRFSLEDIEVIQLKDPNSEK